MMKNIKEKIFLAILAISIIPTIFLLSQITLNHDITESKKYTVKMATMDYLQDHNQPLYITWWKSEELKSSQLDVLSDLLIQLTNIPNVEIFVDIQNPDSEEKQILREKGFREEQIDRELLFSGLEISYLGQSEVIPFILNPDLLEVSLIEAMIRIDNNGFYQLAIFPDATTVKPNGSYTLLTSLLSESFNVTSVSEQTPLTSLPDIMIVPDRKEFSMEELFAIDSAIQSGIPVIFLIDGLYLDPENNDYAVTYDEKSIINQWIRQYGVEVGDALISDANSLKLNYVSENAMRYDDYDLWFNRNYLDVLWSSPVQIRDVDGIDSQILLQSSNRSWLNEGETYIRPVDDKDEYIATGPYSVAVKLKGVFKPLFQSLTGNAEDSLIVIYSSTLSFSDFVQQSGSYNNLLYLRREIFNLLGEKEFYEISENSLKKNLLNRDKIVSNNSLRNIIVFNIIIVPLCIILVYLIKIRIRKKYIE